MEHRVPLQGFGFRLRRGFINRCHICDSRLLKARRLGLRRGFGVLIFRCHICDGRLLAAAAGSKHPRREPPAHEVPGSRSEVQSGGELPASSSLETAVSDNPPGVIFAKMVTNSSRASTTPLGAPLHQMHRSKKESPGRSRERPPGFLAGTQSAATTSSGSPSARPSASA